jgi:hypothetical protein
MLRNSLAKRAGGRRAAGAFSRRFVRARAMVIASTPRQRRVWCHAAAVASHAFQQLSPGSLESSRAGRTGRATSGAQRRGARPRHSVRARRGPELSARQLAVGNEKGQIGINLCCAAVRVGRGRARRGSDALLTPYAARVRALCGSCVRAVCVVSRVRARVVRARVSCVRACVRAFVYIS